MHFSAAHSVKRGRAIRRNDTVDLTRQPVATVILRFCFRCGCVNNECPTTRLTSFRTNFNSSHHTFLHGSSHRSSEAIQADVRLLDVKRRAAVQRDNMPRLPPTTPFLPRLNHPTDESLLLASPVFDDITLDDADFWAVPPPGPSLVPRTPSEAGPSRPPLARASAVPVPPTTVREDGSGPSGSASTSQGDRSGPSGSASKQSKLSGRVGKRDDIADFTLDLDAYLPVDDSVFVEEDTILVGRGQRLPAGHPEEERRVEADGSSSDVSSGSLKRGGGDTPMRTWTKPKKGTCDLADISHQLHSHRMSVCWVTPASLTIPQPDHPRRSATTSTPGDYRIPIVEAASPRLDGSPRQCSRSCTFGRARRPRASGGCRSSPARG
jgi:hypothetical protein